MPELCIPDPVERDDLGAFAARAVRLDGGALVRLRTGAGRVTAWVATPFDTLVTRSVQGSVHPGDITVGGADLIATLAVDAGPALGLGPAQDLFWRAELPPRQGWREVDQVPADVFSDLADRGAVLLRDNPGPPARLLDQKVITISGAGFVVGVPLRCLFALSGMGFLGRRGAAGTVRVSATDSWLRLDARYGAVLRRRHALLPLLTLNPAAP